MSNTNCRHKWVGHQNPGTPDGPGEYTETCAHCGADRDAVESDSGDDVDATLDFAILDGIASAGRDPTPEALAASIARSMKSLGVLGRTAGRTS